MTSETKLEPTGSALLEAARGTATQMLFVHGYIADSALARRLACGPPPRRARPAWRRLVALLGWLGCGAIRAFPH